MSRIAAKLPGEEIGVTSVLIEKADSRIRTESLEAEGLLKRRKSSINNLSNNLAAVPEGGTTPTNEDVKIEEKPHKVNPFLAFAYCDKIDAILIFLALLASGGIGICMPLNMWIFGDGVTGAGIGNWDQFSKMARNQAIIGGVAFVCGLLAVTLLEISAERQTRKIKTLYFQTILRQEVGYYDVKDIGTLASDVNTSCVQIREGVGMKVGQIVRAIVQFIGGYTVALVKDWKMALLMMVVIPCLALSFFVVIKIMGKSSERAKIEYAKAGGIVEEALPAARTIASFNVENIFTDRFSKQLAQSVKADITGSIWKGIAIGTIFMFLYLSYALGWWWGSRTVYKKITEDHDFTYAGAVLTTFFSVVMSAFSLAAVGPNMGSLSTAAQAVASLRDLISRESLIDPYDESGSRPEGGIRGDITFQNVRFAYPSRPDRDVYKDVSFKIEAGQTVALVGPSGCGKSTVIQLIERFYDVTEGSVMMNNNIDVRTMNVKWLRSHMALVSQEPRLFCTTIRENIRFGKPDANEAEIIAAAKSANAHEFVMSLADGYDTMVGQGGSLLSGGQKQRIAIARALLRNPSILILDEATSALDNQSERTVQDALDKLVSESGHKRTTIIIAHRLSTIRNADRIIVFNQQDGGIVGSVGSVVVEDGTHDELMKIENGLYKQLVEAQLKGLDTNTHSQAETDRNAILPLVEGDGVEKDLQQLRKWSKRLSKAHSKTQLKEPLLAPGSVDKTLALDRDKKFNPSRRLLKEMKQDWWLLAVGVIFVSLVGISQPFNGVLIASFVGSFFSPDVEEVKHRGTVLAFVYIGLAVAIFICHSIQSFAFDYTGHKLVFRLRLKLFGNMIHQDMEFFDDQKYNTGFLSSVLSADCEFSRNLVGQNLSLMCQNFVSLIGAFVIASVSTWKLALVTMGMYLLLVPAAYMQVRFIQSTSTKLETEDTEIDSPAFVLNEIITNLKTVASYNLQETLQHKYDTTLTLYYKRGVNNAYITGLACGVTDGLMFFVSAVSYKYAQHLMQYEQLGLEKMMRCNMSISMAGNAVARSAAWSSDKKRAKNACENVFHVIDRIPKMDSRSPLGAILPQSGKQDTTGNIEVNHAKFRYPGRFTVPVLNDVTFNIKAGETIALVGESGSGKSTIIQFLERFYDLEASQNFKKKLLIQKQQYESLVSTVGERQGRELSLSGNTNLMGIETFNPNDMFGGNVTIDRHHIQDLNVKHLRDQFGLVGQEPILFDISIAENIRYGKLDATLEDIEKAAKLANAHEFIIKQPQGYDTKVGKGGNLLSGGQKQRVAIARAIIRDPKILLLDEATSALDPESEQIVQKALDDLLLQHKRTTIVIAHRLSTIRTADKIVVFKPEPGVGSTIAECGNHDELMLIPNGIYRNLVLIGAR